MKQLILFLICILTSTVLAQEKYIIDSNSNCQVLILEPYDNETISWEGGCNDSKASGFGTLIRYYEKKEFARYVGTMKNGVPNGQGTYSFSNGRVFKGNFQDHFLLDLDDKYLNFLSKNIIKLKDTIDIYTRDGSSNDLYYQAIVPVNKIAAVLILMPGSQEPTNETISSNKKLIQLAFDNNIAVIVPSINQRLILNEEILNIMNIIFTDAVEKYELPNDKFILGGWSMGGFFSSRYAAYHYENPKKTSIKPIAVFNVDGPTDLENLFNTWTYNLNNPRNPNKSEQQYALNELEKYIGGKPDKFHSKYVYFSIFSKNETDGGTAKYLKSIPYRIYNDLDVAWWIKNRGTDIYQLNALDQSAMINFLQGIGNTRAEFINSFGNGYRIDGRRHPHSWSIVESEDCIKWILKCLKDTNK